MENKLTPRQAIRQAADLAALGYDCLTYSETLFHAIHNANSLDQAKALAKLGCYLSCDHANLFDVEQETLIQKSKQEEL